MSHGALTRKSHYCFPSPMAQRHICVWMQLEELCRSLRGSGNVWCDVYYMHVINNGVVCIVYAYAMHRPGHACQSLSRF